jgi:hypothetical protein
VGDDEGEFQARAAGDEQIEQNHRIDAAGNGDDDRIVFGDETPVKDDGHADHLPMRFVILSFYHFYARSARFRAFSKTIRGDAEWNPL